MGKIHHHRPGGGPRPHKGTPEASLPGLRHATPEALLPPLESEPVSGAGCLARVVWMALGNVGLLALAAAVAQRKQGFLGVADLAYMAVVMLVVVVRHWDVTELHGTTAKGEPATLRHWREFTVRYVVVAAVLWAVAHAVSLALR